MGRPVQIRLRLTPDAPVEKVFLRTFPDGEQAFTPMQKSTSAPAAQWWAVNIPVEEPTVHYRFLIQAAGEIWHYSTAGPTRHTPLDSTDFRLLADYHPPDWLPGAVFYQIFPDRFANADPETDPQPHEYNYKGFGPRTFPWGTRPDPDQPFSLAFYGGDLPGIEQHLDHLENLGVNALYLNPIFTAYSNHKYDVADYDQVDPHFGGNQALVNLAAALHRRNMRYLLDIVPNHCGYWHPWFQAALQDPHAPTADFFTFTNHPQVYATWLGVWTLPKLNYNSRELRRRIYAGPEAVFRRWLRPPYSADGWRVDVANMLGRQGPTQIGSEVATGIRRAVKETNPNAYLMGENFFDATATLQGDEWDGVMNYAGLAMPLLYWLVHYQVFAHGLEEPIQEMHPWPTAALLDTWRSRLGAIPWVIAQQQYNILGSHDVPRLRSILNENDALHRLALVVQFTFPGVPGIYYGDEIGLTDDPDLQSRGCMVWNQDGWDHDLLAFYRRLIKLRRTIPALQHGGFQPLAAEQDMIAFLRDADTGRVITIAQRSTTPRPAGPLPISHAGIPNGTRFVEQFNGWETYVENGHLPLPDLPQGATLWLES
jgi:alpha-glucosidase